MAGSHGSRIVDWRDRAPRAADHFVAILAIWRKELRRHFVFLRQGFLAGLQTSGCVAEFFPLRL